MYRQKLRSLTLSLAVLLAACGGSSSGGGGTTPTQPSPDQAPTANLSVTPDSGYAPLSVEVKVTGTDPDGSVAHYKLDTNGNGTFDVDQTSPIDTTLSYQATKTLHAQVVDDQGKASASVSHQVTIRATATLTVNVTEATYGPQANVLDGIITPTVPITATLLTQNGDTAAVGTSDSNGQVVIPSLAPAKYILHLSDNPTDPDSVIGKLNDISNPSDPDTADLTHGDMTLEETLPDYIKGLNTVYPNNVVFLQQLQGSVIQTPPNDPGLPTIKQRPIRMVIDTAGMPSQAWADSIDMLVTDWNGPNQDYGNYIMVPMGQPYDLQTEFAQTLPNGQKILSSAIDAGNGIWYINPVGMGLQAVVQIGHHEAEFMAGVINNEAKNSVGYYCAQPSGCEKVDIEEIEFYQEIKELRAKYGNWYDLMKYNPFH